MGSNWSPTMSSVQLNATPPVSASPNYTSGDNMGGLITLADAVLGAHEGGASRILHGLITDKAAQGLQIDAILFNAEPTASTFTDNATAVIHADDATKVIDILQFATWVTADQTFSTLRNLDIPFRVAKGSAALYVGLITRGAHNLASTSDIFLQLHAEPL